MSDENIDNRFDEAIHGKIESHTTSGTELLWESIATNVAELDREKRKKRFLIYSWTAIGIATALLILALFLPLQRDQFYTQKGAELGNIRHESVNNHQIITSFSDETISTNVPTYPEAQLQKDNLTQKTFASNSSDLLLNEDKQAKNASNISLNFQDPFFTDSLEYNFVSPSSSDSVLNNHPIRKLDTISAQTITPLQKKDTVSLNYSIESITAEQDSTQVSDSLSIAIDLTSIPDSSETDPPAKRLHFLEVGTQQLRTSAYYKYTGLAAGQNEAIELTDGFGVYAHCGLQLNKRIELNSGLNFEKTELEQRLATELDNFNFYTAFGEVFIEEEENQVESDFFFVERYFYYLELPIGITYNFVSKKRLQINISGDLILNYLINQSNRSEAYIKLGNQAKILPLNFSCAIGLGGQYNFRRGWSVVSDLRYNLMLNSISSDKDVSIRPYSIGLGVGIKKYF